MTTQTLPSSSRMFYFTLLLALVALTAVFFTRAPAPTAPVSAQTQAQTSAVASQSKELAAEQRAVAVVTVVGKRMSPEQKAAFDRDDKDARIASRA